MIWVLVAVVGAFVLLLVARAVRPPDEGGAKEASAPASSKGRSPAVDRVSAVGDAAKPTRSSVERAAARDAKDEEEPEGTKLASIPPPGPAERAKVVDLTDDAPPPSRVRDEKVIEPSVSISFEEIEDDEPTGIRALMLVTAVGRTDAGRRRKHNEDAYLTMNDQGLFVIADGMGGYAAGEVASQLAVDVISEAYKTKTFAGEPEPTLPRRGDELVRAIQMANTAILTQARANDAQFGMGTTLVSLRFSPNKQRVYVAHVGDSRCYRIRDAAIKQLTQDHTLGAVGITGPAAAKLSRAVGIGDTVEVDLEIDSPREGDVYMLCSDGLSKMVPDEATRDIILGEKKDLDAAVKKLVDAANERGGRDNISVILVRVDEVARIGTQASEPRQKAVSKNA